MINSQMSIEHIAIKESCIAEFALRMALVALIVDVSFATMTCEIGASIALSLPTEQG
jgi:hypothetical protein